jgi:hypothetical protein
MRVAYADPPYVGQAKRHYGTEEVNHTLLISHLEEYDAWALSCSSPSLHSLLPLCPPEIRIMAWVKPFAVFKPNVNPAYAWEPILVKTGRKRSRQQPTVRDWVSANITLKRGLVGVKPAEVCEWLFEVMNMKPSDEFVDLFPGSGAVTDAWTQWKEKASIKQPQPQSQPLS